jgi:hypothetical protein
MDELKLAFLSSVGLENNTIIRGAILVTDKDTKPVEFRVTGPVSPTNFQRTLYGDVLQEYILVEIIGIPLLNNLSEKPNILIVRDPLFFGISRLVNDLRLIRLFKEEEAQIDKKSKYEQLSSLGGKYEPLMVETSKEYEEELSDIRQQLSEVFKYRNLLEPFERVELACKQVHTQKV